MLSTNSGKSLSVLCVLSQSDWSIDIPACDVEHPAETSRGKRSPKHRSPPHTVQSPLRWLFSFCVCVCTWWFSASRLSLLSIFPHLLNFPSKGKHSWWQTTKKRKRKRRGSIQDRNRPRGRQIGPRTRYDDKTKTRAVATSHECDRLKWVDEVKHCVCTQLISWEVVLKAPGTTGVPTEQLH